MILSGSGDKNLNGEIGLLKKVEISQIEPPTYLFLIMEHQGSCYLNTMMIKDSKFCRQVHFVFQQQIGQTIQKIGDSELLLFQPPSTPKDRKNKSAKKISTRVAKAAT